MKQIKTFLLLLSLKIKENTYFTNSHFLLTYLLCMTQHVIKRIGKFRVLFQYMWAFPVINQTIKSSTLSYGDILIVIIIAI